MNEDLVNNYTEFTLRWTCLYSWHRFFYKKSRVQQLVVYCLDLFYALKICQGCIANAPSIKLTWSRIFFFTLQRKQNRIFFFNSQMRARTQFVLISWYKVYLILTYNLYNSKHSVINTRRLDSWFTQTCTCSHVVRWL